MKKFFPACKWDELDGENGWELLRRLCNRERATPAVAAYTYHVLKEFSDTKVYCHPQYRGVGRMDEQELEEITVYSVRCIVQRMRHGHEFWYSANGKSHMRITHGATLHKYHLRLTTVSRSIVRLVTVRE